MDVVDQIKSKLPIEDLVGQYVQLKKVGRHFKALCPFHSEKTPSFYVSPEKQLAYCFGCHRGGDHFKFLQEMEGLDFPEALKFLAEKTGITLPRKSFSKEKKTERDHLFDIHREATAYFSDHLWNTDEGKKVLDYLRKRGLKEETIQSFQLGFSPDDFHALSDVLLKKGFTKSELVSSGLVISEEVGGEKIHDRFRGRLMFPIIDVTGRICAFGGRALKKGEEAKYMNSPETPIYQKRSTLYGLFQSKTEIKKKNSVIIVEGYMDLLSCFQYGCTNVVAISGTALTEEQLALLRRFTGNLVFSFDHDEAGKIAGRRSFELAQGANFSIRKISWSEEEGKDPDEILRKNPKIFEKALEEALSYIESVFREIEQTGDTKTLEGKKRALEMLLPLLSFLGSALEKDTYIRKLALLLNVDPRIIYDELSKEKRLTSFPKKEESGERKSISIQDYLLSLLISYPSLFSLAKNKISLSDFISEEGKSLYRAIENKYNTSRSEDQNFPPELQEKAKVLYLLSETTFQDLPYEVIEKECEQAILNFLRDRMRREKNSLLNRIRKAEGAHEQEELQKLFTTYSDLLTQGEP